MAHCVKSRAGLESLDDWTVPGSCRWGFLYLIRRFVMSRLSSAFTSEVNAAGFRLSLIYLLSFVAQFFSTGNLDARAA